MKLGIKKQTIDDAAPEVKSELMAFLRAESDRTYQFELTPEMFKKHAAILRSKPDGTKSVISIITEQIRQRREQRIGAPVVRSEEHLAARRGWFKNRDSWKAAMKEAVKFAKDAANLGASLASTVVSKIDIKTRSLRVLSCHGIDDAGNQIQPPCVHRAYSVEKRFHFCNACGCGDQEIARLSAVGSDAAGPNLTEHEWVKLDYPYLACPIGAAGFSNEKPPK